MHYEAKPSPVPGDAQAGGWSVYDNDKRLWCLGVYSEPAARRMASRMNAKSLSKAEVRALRKLAAAPGGTLSSRDVAVAWRDQLIVRDQDARKVCQRFHAAELAIYDESKNRITVTSWGYEWLGVTAR